MEGSISLWGTMQGCEYSGGIGKSETGLQSLSQSSQKRVWDRESRAGLSIQSSENRTKVCGWMGYVVGDLGTSSDYGEVWIGVLVWCYIPCNTSYFNICCYKRNRDI